MVFDGQVRSGKLTVAKALYFFEGSLSMVMKAILECAAWKGGLPNENEMKRRGDAIQLGSRALTRQRLRC
ncbi:hypothetical protein D3C72_2191260 [compost metagenome]